MKLRRHTKFLIAASCLNSLTLGNPVLAGEIFHWVDEDGILNFSDWAPANTDVDVEKLTVSDSNPPGYDPNEDQNSILGQAERMNERWSELKERQDERRKGRLELQEQQRLYRPVVYDDYGYNDSYYYRPIYGPVQRPGIGHRRPFRVQTRQFAALDQLGLTGPRPHSINSSAHLARINATQSLNSGFQARPPGKMHHASAYKEW